MQWIRDQGNRALTTMYSNSSFRVHHAKILEKSKKGTHRLSLRIWDRDWMYSVNGWNTWLVITLTSTEVIPRSARSCLYAVKLLIFFRGTLIRGKRTWRSMNFLQDDARANLSDNIISAMPSRLPDCKQWRIIASKTSFLVEKWYAQSSNIAASNRGISRPPIFRW